MKQYLVTQLVIMSEYYNRDTNVMMVTNSHITRRVNADNKETAIGIFAEKTRELKALQKLDIECYLLEDIELFS